VLALETAVESGASAEGEISAANGELTAANAQHDVELVQKEQALRTLAQGDVQAVATINQLTADRDQFQIGVNQAAREANEQCLPAAFETAAAQGYSFSGKNRNPTVDPNTGQWEVPRSSSENGGSRSWSPSAVEAQQQKCEDAKQAYNDILTSNVQQSKKDAVAAGIAAAQMIIENNTFTEYELLPAQERAALARLEAAQLRNAVVPSQAATGAASQRQVVQQALGELLAAGVALTGAANQAKLAKSRIDLDVALENAVLENRFSLRRTFRSYDLWRARALAENARRLAVAARRAIESRFVVDMSTLKAPETFVEAPALWADEIFSPDLKPPSAVGRTAAPANTTGLYSSKLVDYVNNLELFVNGYTIARPTASVRSDTEIVQLAGPAAISEAVADDGTVYEFRGGDAGGWSFYCAGSGLWTRHPQAASFDPTDWGIATMCGGKPPTRARLGFWLDPWGRPLGATGNPPSNVRHNARWHTFAVNLVGSGIRDCAEADDAPACYAEPFIRYEIQHVGPALLSDYDQSWVSYDIPTGVVEGGKALASEEWLDPASNGFQSPVVSSIARQEFAGRPLGGAYELVLELTPDVRPERIERIQVLLQSDYWVRQL